MPNGIPIEFQMAEKNANKQTHRHTDTQTDTHFRIYISRDLTFRLSISGDKLIDLKKMATHNFSIFGFLEDPINETISLYIKIEFAKSHYDIMDIQGALFSDPKVT